MSRVFWGRLLLLGGALVVSLVAVEIVLRDTVGARIVSRRPVIVLAAAVTLVAPGPARPADQMLSLDIERTVIRFTVGATLHQVEGTVRVEHGKIRFHPEGGAASGEIVIDATSAETGNRRRDRDMHEKVLESDRFGTFVLRPTATTGVLAPSGPSQVELRGELEIHGGVHSISLPAELTVDGDRVTGTASLEVPYVDWGMKDPSKLLLRVKKLVKVEITLAGALSAAAQSSE